ncbi:MAG: anaerobic ribonucleoside-triphosphate reductase activating protein [Thermoanaerobacteraceae bacterium]|uniref:anaerobic ribonucleoside-triphosphate reductase activating protein n=1 Tax=Thermanaeromonas sp. C210 TaxID=2731925 RepID=UPI00155B83A8|nr:anaerobic ribonucleoside-triphosphate reductase activating protein [Thermanaeromonas sp. C210]MBE3581113.1 anaerobic ribonucleoside-triphosphate reductase activating protein [Thermoanaerobacteraceae bacterium]GFN22127.1 anaerobic ribonucleoside-triphosphate reductase activating protein [Thermanaeromonas sp. C210]
MAIRGIHKTSLVDFPGEVCTTVFFGGCNFRCPWCHNADLVLRPSALPEIPPEEVLAFLDRRKSFIRAVCLTGGEPTLARGLEDFICQLKGRGFKVKIDTNGTRPEVIAGLLEKGLLDYVAMDVKGPLEKYNLLTGVKADLGAVKESVNLLKNSRTAYEFRTTMVPGLLSEEELLALGPLLAGARRYVLQAFRPADSVINGYYRDIPPCSEATLKNTALKLAPFFGRVEIRA